MPVTAHSYAHFQAPAGNPPAAPATVTSITKDAGATISFLPGAAGDYPVSAWLVTPYIGGSAQSPQAAGTGSAATITTSSSSTYTQVPVTGLSNGTAYTFTVRGVSAAGTGAESAASGANTPYAGLVFGDDFNGPTIDPEWWVYNRCGYLAQSEVQYYLPSQCVLDGSGNLQLTAQHTSHTGPSYPSAGGGNVTQPWISGACQSNTRTYAPTGSNTMTFEVRQAVMADAGNGFWPGFLWLEGQAFLDAWKTDPAQTGWNSTTQAEIDIAEWPSGQSGTTQFVENSWTGAAGDPSSHAPAPGGGYNATAMHVYQARWKPSATASLTFWLDGAQQFSAGHIPATGAQFFLLIYLQMVAGGPTTTESCFVDYVRVFDQ